MKKALIAIGAIVLVLVVAVLVAPSLIPVETYKGELLSRIKESTGRDARIGGEFSLSVFPRVEVTAGKVSLANAPGAKPSDMVSLDRLNVRIALFPLIAGNVVVDSFVLEKPLIHLEVDRKGQPNWRFQTTRPGEAAAPKPAPGAPPAGDAGLGIAGLQLGDVRLVDGRIIYADAMTGDSYTVDNINMKVSLPSPSSPMVADGSLVWNKEKIQLSLRLSDPIAFLNGRETSVEAGVRSSPVRLVFNGRAANPGTVKAGGRVDLDVPSVRKLAAWAGAPLEAPGSGFGPLKISGTVQVDGKKYAFRDARLSVDAMNGTGAFAYDGGRARPHVTGRLELDKVDLNPYLPPEGAAAGGAAAKPAAGGRAVATKEPAGWSDEPIELGALRQADADLDLTVGGLIMRKIKIGESNVKVSLKDGLLVTELTRMAAYGGNGRARVTADARQPIPATRLSFALAGFQANPFLSDAMDLAWLEGTANADIDLAARGRSQREMVSALAGKGTLRFENGAIRGVNLAAMARNVKSAFLDPSARARQKTDFTELGGTFTIVKGILRNDDLAMKSPLLRLAGRGTADLPKRTVNYRLEPKVVATTKGQGGRDDAGGIRVPVIIEGPWDEPRYRPDLSAMIGDVAKDPKKALEGVKGILEGARPPSSGDGAPSKSPLDSMPKPADALKKLFGR